MSTSTSSLRNSGLGFRVDRFQQFATLLVVYLLGVILFGAWVRVTGSGAGCGESWPTCHGQIIPRTPSEKTVIEFTHRVTSGVLGPLVLALPIWAWRRFPAGHLVRRCSWAMLVLVVMEAAIGAGLVLGGLVAQDDSFARALAIVLHLGNTLLLMACAGLTVGCAGRAMPPHSSGSVSRTNQRAATWFVAGLAIAACLGAITALGDTLFPVGSRVAEQAGGTHWLIRLRVVHPVVATAVALLGFSLVGGLPRIAGIGLWARAVGILLLLQLLVGIVNIALRAPGWLQLLHLFFAQLLWMSAVLLAHRVRSAYRFQQLVSD